MKKLIVVVAVVLFMAGLFSSCNNEACPAYSHANTEQTGSNG